MQTQTNDMRNITAFFDNRADAEKTIESLTRAGVSRDAISMVEGNDPSADSTAGAPKEKGFFESIGDFFLPDEDRQSYAEGLRRGGYLVSVQAAAEDTQQISDILEADGSVNMDERTESWRSEGWTGFDARDTAAAPVSTPEGGEAVGKIEVVEEKLRVGKRDVSRGGVRARAYTVEDVVSEDVDLRSETVSIDRRPVDRVVDDADAAFADRTVDVEETSQEAVVSKEARVMEEIDITKSVDTATETVSGTVRRTEVEIEDDRKAALNPAK